jgi:hypothetical protein
MDPDGDRADIVRLAQGLPAVMFGRVEELVRAHKTRWVVADVSMNWVLDLAGTAGVRVALFSTFSAAIFVLRMRVPKMVEDGIIDESGKSKPNPISLTSVLSRSEYIHAGHGVSVCSGCEEE